MDTQTESAAPNSPVGRRNAFLDEAIYSSESGQLKIVLVDVITRRIEQDQRWGGAEHDDQHTPYDWYNYICKQLTEAYSHCNVYGNPHAFRDRMVDVAALALAAICSRDRCEVESSDGENT